MAGRGVGHRSSPGLLIAQAMSRWRKCPRVKCQVAAVHAPWLLPGGLRVHRWWLSSRLVPHRLHSLPLLPHSTSLEFLLRVLNCARAGCGAPCSPQVAKDAGHDVHIRCGRMDSTSHVTHQALVPFSVFYLTATADKETGVRGCPGHPATVLPRPLH